MEIAEKLRETAASVLPVTGVVLFLGLTLVPIGLPLLLWFLAGSVLLTLGLTIFLLGVDLGISPVGERCGAAITARRNLPLMLGAAFVIGLVVTAAEPDIQVFGDQVRGVFAAVDKRHLTYSIAGGVGVFMALGVLRSAAGFALKPTLLASYALVAALALFAPKAFVGIAFDSGGATTGPLTVPFIMALGVGVSAVRADPSGSFGLTGIASVGPLLAVLGYSLLLGSGPEGAAAAAGAQAAPYGIGRAVVAHALRETASSILPLFALTLLLQVFLIRMSARQMARVGVGFAYAFVGLSVFLVGVNCGFMQAGQALGAALGGAAAAHGGLWYAGMVAVGLVFGAVIVCAEPAVWVLSEQVEQVSGGMVRRRALLVFLSIGTALAIALALWRAVAGFHIAWLVVPGYLSALALMPFCPPLFTGIAFDSGGVASGPLTSTFILSFALGAASGGSGTTDSFGVIALVAMMLLTAIQLMGIVFEARRRRALAAAGSGGAR